MLNRGATKYALEKSAGIDSIDYKRCIEYEQALWDLFRDEVLDKQSEEGLAHIFAYENGRYATYHNREDEDSKNIARMSNDMRYSIASALRERATNLNETRATNLNEVVETLASKTR